MTPYASAGHAALVLGVGVPTLLLERLGRRPSWALLAGTLCIVGVQLGAGAAGPPWPLLEAMALSAWWYGVAIAFCRFRARRDSRVAPWIAVGATLAPWLVVKGAGPVAGGWPVDLVVMGLSYVTLRAVDLVLSIQDRVVKVVPLGDFLAYLWFFPTLLAGPVDRFRRFSADLRRTRSPGEIRADLDVAVDRIFTGLLYKLVVATLIERHWLGPAGAASGWGATLSYMYAYTFHLFFDFAGYSAFAVGVSRALGVHTPENFTQPFLATNIREFWNRWHASLSAFLRDHVYMRLVMAATRRKWFARGETAGRLAILASFTLMGLWHGFSLRFLFYGLFHAAIMLGFDALGRWSRGRRAWGDGPAWRVAGALITLHVFAASMLIFSGRLDGLWGAVRTAP